MVHLSHVAFGYRKKQALFDELSFEVREDSIYGLLGKNGAGKSTLLKLVSGLVIPTKGKVSVLGYEPAQRRPSFLEKVFYLPEEIDTPDVHVLTFADLHAPFYPKFSKEQFRDYLSILDVPIRGLHQMSYGQKKKASIAFGLATNTSLLLLDEPTNGLDIPSKKQFRKLMASVMNDNRAIVISTHQVRDLDQIINRVAIMEEGKMLLNMSVDDIMNKLSFVEGRHMNAAEAVYSERTLMGTSAIVASDENAADGPLDIELLFNAITSDPVKMQSLLNRK